LREREREREEGREKREERGERTVQGYCKIIHTNKREIKR